MKLAFFTPFHPACGPGFMSKAVVECLKDYFDITVFYQWHAAHQPYEVEDVEVRVIESDMDMESIARNYDAVVYNLGNNEENHYAIINALKKLPGIVVLHDFVMQHGIVNDIFNRKQKPELYYWLLAALYGKDGVRVSHTNMLSYARGVRGGWDSPSVSSFPMFEIFSGLASACVVHSKFFEGQLKPHFAGPILRTRNPYDLKRAPSDEVIDSFYKVREKAGGKVVFAAFGHMSPSKCIDRVLRVFAHSDRLKKDARLILCGGTSVEYEKYLRRLVAIGDLNDVVEFRGSVSDTELYALQVEADVFVNLRQPNTEGQSGSLIEQLAAGKPVICYDTGCYADLDEGDAYKVHSVTDLNELQDVFERVLTGIEERRTIGMRGRAVALEYDCARYARELFEFIFENREYLRAFQRRDFESLRRFGVSGSAIDARHPEAFLKTQAIWGVLDGFVSNASSQALSLIPADARPHYLSFLTQPYRPLAESLLDLQSIDDVSADERDRTLELRGISLYATESGPVLDRSFWSELDSSSGRRFVYICYKKLLCRDPDLVGLRDYAERLESGEISSKTLILAMLRSTEFAERFGELRSRSEYVSLARWADA
jgi:glycosyltransferase involved in cell wall biosynthesis